MLEVSVIVGMAVAFWDPIKAREIVYRAFEGVVFSAILWAFLLHLLG